MDPQWLTWAKKLQAIAQTGLTYSLNHYDTERYEAIRLVAAEMMAAGSMPPIEAQTLMDFFARDTGYCTPKVDVRAAVFCEDRLLLVQEREDGCWTLPGGWADVGDAPSEAAVREVKEESGYDVAVRKLAAVHDRNRHGHPPIPYHAYKLFFLCDLVGGAPAPSYETLDTGFFDEDQMPELSLTRIVPAQIAHLYEHHRHPDWPTSFD